MMKAAFFLSLLSFNCYALAPSRMADLQVIMTKTWSEKQLDGSYKTQTDTICKTTAKVPVYESANPPEDLQPLASCLTELKTGPSTVRLLAFVQVVRGFENPFKAGELIDYKLFAGVFTVNNTRGDFSRVGDPGISIVEDVRHRNMIQILNSSQLTANKAEDIKIDENISVAIRFED